MALLSLVDNLTHTLENGEYVVSVYLDFSKAFDTMNPMILLQSCTTVVFGVVPIIGSLVVWQTDHNLLHIMVSKLILKISNVVYHKGLFWVNFSFFYISMTWLMPVTEHFQFYLLMIQMYL